METLAVEARNDQHGASMFGLMEAAIKHDLNIIGVAVDSLDQLSFPFIAHVDDDHFLLVVSRNGEYLSISDNGAEPEIVLVSEFSARWKGKALIAYQEGDALAAMNVLDLDSLKGARGGTGSSNDNNAPPTPPPGARSKVIRNTYRR